MGGAVLRQAASEDAGLTNQQAQHSPIQPPVVATRTTNTTRPSPPAKHLMSAPPREVPSMVPPSRWIPSTLFFVSTTGRAFLS